MANRRKKKSAAPAVIVAILLTAVVVFFAPRLIHKCDDCGEVFFGTGYKPNAVVDTFSSDQQIICKSCAEKQHALSGLFGGEVEEYSYGLFDYVF